jgi:hypothetical protein
MSYGGPPQNQYGGAGYYDQQGQQYPPQQGYPPQQQQGYYPPEVSLYTKHITHRCTEQSRTRLKLSLSSRTRTAEHTNFPRCRASKRTVSPNTANTQDPMINKVARATRGTPHSTSRVRTLPKAVLDMDSLPSIAATRPTLPSNSSTRQVAARAPRTMVAHLHTSKDRLVL